MSKSTTGRQMLEELEKRVAELERRLDEAENRRELTVDEYLRLNRDSQSAAK